ncbi:MAG TPA: extracellular solute-binding protein [Thermomicrobiales bacterium]|nr:extracellular solute-binding protein [Thermomicrobiales bacterium]
MNRAPKNHYQLGRRPSGLTRRRLLQGTAGLSAAAALQAGRWRHAGAQEFSGDLTVWGVVSFTTEGDELLAAQMNEWGEANGVNVEYVPQQGSDYQVKLATAVEAGAVPDIAMMQGDLTHFYAAQDRLVDLSDLFDRIKDQAGGMWEPLLPHVQVDGKTFSIPMETDVSVMYARLDLVEEATGTRIPPATLDELEAVAREINNPPRLFGIGLALGRSPDAVANVEQMIFAEGGTLVDEQGNPAIDNAGTVLALTRIKRWWEDSLIPPDATAWDDSSNNKAYQSGQVAFTFNPASIFAFLEENDPELLGNTTQAPFPAGTAGSFPLIGTWSWAIFQESSNIDAAKALIEYIMEPERLQAVYEEVGGRWYPVYKDLVEAEFWQSRPFFEPFPEIIENGRREWYPAEATPLLLTQLSAVFQRFILADMAQAVVVSGTSPEQAAAEAQIAMEQVFEELAAEQ